MTSGNAMMTDKEIFKDCLTSEKFMAAGYNSYADECAHPELRCTMINILQDTHTMQAEIFTEMNSRGWYPVKQAQQADIDQAKQKLTSGQ